MSHKDPNVILNENYEVILYNSCTTTVFTTLQTLFLALAVMANINKWIYFTMRIQAQINIREYQIAEMVADEQEEMLDQ